MKLVFTSSILPITNRIKFETSILTFLKQLSIQRWFCRTAAPATEYLMTITTDF